MSIEVKLESNTNIVIRHGEFWGTVSITIEEDNFDDYTVILDTPKAYALAAALDATAYEVDYATLGIGREDTEAFIKANEGGTDGEDI